MPEHVHQWGVVDSWPDRGEELHAECFWGWKASDYKQQCSAVLDDDEVDRRLNALEGLKKLIADLEEDSKDGPNEMGGPFLALSVIARTLEED